MSAEPIQFPIVFRYHKNVVPSGPDIVRIWRLKHVAENRFRMPESKKGKAVLHWIVDGHGRLREAKVVGASLEWLRPLSWLWRFTQTIYEIAPGRTVTVRELLDLNGGASRDPEKSSARSFRHYLSKQPPDADFTRTMFLEFYHESPDVSYPTYP